MGTTPAFAIPYIEPTDHPNTYPVNDKAQAQAVEAALLTGSSVWGWAKQSAAQSIATATSVPIDGLALDTGSVGVTLVGAQLRAPTAGLYLVTAFLQFLHASATGSRAMFIHRNTSQTLMRSTAGVGASTTSMLTGCFVFPLAAGDLIGINGYQTTGAALNTDPASNSVSFQIARL